MRFVCSSDVWNAIFAQNQSEYPAEESAVSVLQLALKASLLYCSVESDSG